MKIKNLLWELERAKDSVCLSREVREAAGVAADIVAGLIALHEISAELSSFEIEGVIAEARHAKAKQQSNHK